MHLIGGWRTEGQQDVVSRWKADILGDSFFRFLDFFDAFLSNTTTNHIRSWISARHSGHFELKSVHVVLHMLFSSLHAVKPSKGRVSIQM